MNFTSKILLFLFFLTNALIAQQDIFIVYNSANHSYDTLDSPTYDTSITSDNTNWYFGTLPGFTNLPQVPPQITFPGSGFTELIRADSIFTMTDFPIRTAVKLFGYLNDSLVTQCSGIIVGNNLILTSAHCVCYRFDSTYQRVFLDSAVIFPAYNDGSGQPLIGKSSGTVYYLPLDWYNNTPQTWKDVSLIALDRPIGDLTGWVGLGFNSDETFFNEKLLYKFSYPVGGLGWDSSRFFDERLMYFNYGYIDTITLNSFGYFIDGIPGQSGSSLIFSNNNSFVSYGNQVWSGNSMHLRITKRNYFIMKKILTEIVGVNDPDIYLDVNGFNLEQNFPNPFNSSTIINYYIPNSKRISLKLFNVLGQEIFTLFEGLQNEGFHSMNFDASELSSGIYIYRLISDGFNLSKKMILLR